MTLNELLAKINKNCVYLWDIKNNIQDWFDNQKLTKEQLDSIVIDWEINYEGHLFAKI